MNCHTLLQLLKADKKRVESHFILKLLYTNTTSFVFWFRLSSYLKSHKYLKPLHGFAELVRLRQSHKLGIQLSSATKIGGGISIKHYSGIVIAEETRIGENCTIHQCVTLGRSFGGKHAGCPTIGNHCIIFPGAKVIGKVRLGNNVIVGANAVVLHDIPDNCVCAGVPAKIISSDSSKVIGEERFRKHFGLLKYDRTN